MLRQGVVNGPTSLTFGRELELAALSGFLDRIESGPCALVIEGTAGIGKTTLWLAGVADARKRGHRVLVARAAESEARLSYAALGDLLAGVPDSAFVGMPVPLRRALDAALLRTELPAGSLSAYRDSERAPAGLIFAYGAVTPSEIEDGHSARGHRARPTPDVRVIVWRRGIPTG